MPTDPHTPYINRTFKIGETRLSIGQLVAKLGVAVVLAEPGAGKTRSLKHIADLNGTGVIRASVFRKQTISSAPSILIIDAFDEVAKLDQSVLDEIIVKAHETGAQKLIVASRSSEWAPAQSQTIEDCFGLPPSLVYLEPLSEDEQREFFEAYLPRGDFQHFQSELSRHDMGSLAGTPQFLKMLIESYVTNERTFLSRATIYEDSAKRAVREFSSTAPTKNRLSAPQLIAIAEQAFAALLLAGCDGVVASDQFSTDQYPNISDVLPHAPDNVFQILDTMLFRPGNETGSHEPIHKIVAEYLAARFITDAIRSPAQSLSLKRVLALVAPRDTCRDELRGLLGWMASLGDETVTNACIDIDPYAVIGNGDPALLSRNAKERLLKALLSLSEIDPYFRRSDKFRRFNVGRFFGPEICDVCAKTISDNHTSEHLRQLLLELLAGADALPEIADAFEKEILNPDRSDYSRELALSCLLKSAGPAAANCVDMLLQDPSRISLSLCATILNSTHRNLVHESKVLEFAGALKNIYRPHREYRDQHELGSRVFVKVWIGTLDVQEISQILDHLTASLDVNCGCKNEKLCDCRVVESKVIGKLIDQYFATVVGPLHLQQLWSWLHALKFENRRGVQDSLSVKSLRENAGVRQRLQLLAISGLTNRDEIWDAIHVRLQWRVHSGLWLGEDDYVALLEHAFESQNLLLWEALWRSHSPYTDKKACIVRKVMRSHALENKELAKIWYRREREKSHRKVAQADRKYNRRIKRRKRRDDVTKNKNLEHFRANESLIRAGQHFGWLCEFALLTLDEEDAKGLRSSIPQTSIEEALQNGLPLIDQHLPTFVEAAQTDVTYAHIVLIAAAVIEFRLVGTLSRYSAEHLKLVKLKIDVWRRVPSEEAEAIHHQIDSIIFDGDFTKRDYVELSAKHLLYGEPNSIGSVSLVLDRAEFAEIRKQIARDWLLKVPEMPLPSASYLFRLVAQKPMPPWLLEYVFGRLDSIISSGHPYTHHQFRFWVSRAFLATENAHADSIDWIYQDKSAIFELEAVLSRLEGDFSSYWVTITAKKLFQILDAFVDHWPKVALKSSWGTGDPEEERAYRLLSEVIWRFAICKPTESQKWLTKILGDSRFSDYHDAAKTLLAEADRKANLELFSPPEIHDVAHFFIGRVIASVEDLRALLLDEFVDIQDWLDGSSTDPIKSFYDGGEHVSEIVAVQRIVDRLEHSLKSKGLLLNIEHHMRDGKRCDITVNTIINGRETTLVIEAKGQWNKDLYSAPKEQLFNQYAIYPGAIGQGQYLVFWFGPEEKIAGVKNHAISSANLLRDKIVESLPKSLLGVIDVIVLDVEKSTV